MRELLLVWALAPAEVALDLEADSAFDAPWLGAAFAQEPADAPRPIAGHRLPGLVDTSRLELLLEAEGLAAANEEITTEAKLVVRGPVTHPFSSDVRELSLAIGLYAPAQADEAFARLTTPPLQLSQAELDRKLPSPVAGVSGGMLMLAELPPGTATEIAEERELGHVSLLRTRLPRSLLLTESYDLVQPSPADVLLILRQGGTADLAALTRWATEREGAVPPEFTPEIRRDILALVQQRYRSMRAPPALGDFHRLSAMLAMIRLFGSSDDLVSLLRLERPMKILHTSALLSYDLALREEASLGLPVHGMHELPALSQLLEAPGAALKTLRAPALHELLRLAFDPIDFRDAPAAMRSTVPALAPQASQLLAPLAPTDVGGVLKAAGDRMDVQREVFRFYIDARHAPVVEYLADWLTQHPDAAASLGKQAVTAMPEAMLPVLMRHYVDPKEPDDRALVRGLLETLPPEHAHRVLAMLQSLGLPTDAFVGTPRSKMVQAFDAFEVAERRFAQEKARALVEQLKTAGTDEGTLRSSMRAAARLGRLDPAAIEDQGPLVIEILQAAAWEFDAESPAERTKALGLLASLPWGRHEPAAKRAFAVTEAKLRVKNGDTQGALEHLLAFDASLSHASVRSLFVDTLLDQFRSQLQTRAFAAADRTLALARERIPENLDLEILGYELLWAQYRPAFLLGTAFLLAFVTTLTWLAARAVAGLLQRVGRARADIHRLLRRRADAQANAEEVADFSDPAAEHELMPSTHRSAAFDGVPRRESIAADDAPAPDRAANEVPSGPIVEASPSKPTVDDALLGEFAGDGGFDDPFDDLGDDPFGDEFGWSRDLPADEAQHG